jgi:mitochondrial fission protein ELM1
MIIGAKVIWVLADDRPGNYSQAIGLAESLSKLIPATIEIKKINYNFLAKLPNFLKIDGLMGIDLASRNSLLNVQSGCNPHIIISAGRKTAPINLFLKSYHKAAAIQIMNPNLNSIQFSKFDLVILPEHDKIIDHKNVVRMVGALTRISEQLLESEYQKFASQLEKISSPKIVLLVGGSSKKGKFDAQIAKNLGEVVSRVVNNMKANLLILNSRRTGDEITEILDQNCVITQTKIFFKWHAVDWKNPYLAVLKAADFIIATGDSISMCSEICSLGKPVYIFNPEQICSKKHLRFHQNLFDQKFAKKLEQAAIELEIYLPEKLDETNRIAKEIVSYINSKKIL